MVSVDDAVIARLEKDHSVFEILVDSEKALEFRAGKPMSMENIVAVREIFKDVKKGERVPASDLKKYFGTTDIYSVMETIIRKGDVQITTEHRRKLLEQKTKEICDIISRQSVNPQTKLPNPPLRIENAIRESHCQIDPFRPAREQVKAVIEKIQAVIPISMELAEIAVKIPMQYAGKASSQIRTFATVKTEEWRGDGWYGVIQIPAGMQADVFEKLNNLTHGSVETRILKREAV